MKRLFAGLCLMAATTMLSAQGGPASPSQTASITSNGKTISITYSAPSVRGRAGKLFGAEGRISHDPTYPVWRAGANTATLLHTDAELEIGSVKVPKGDYSLYIDLTDPANWVLIINKQTGQWGTVYDKTQDVVRVPMKMEKPAALVEQLKFMLTEGKQNQLSLALAWENLCGTVGIAVR